MNIVILGLVVLTCVLCLEVTPGLGWHDCSGNRIGGQHYWADTQDECRREKHGKCCYGSKITRAHYDNMDYCGGCYDGDPVMEYCQYDGDWGCERGGCLGEPIYVPGTGAKSLKESHCDEHGGRCCAHNINGAASYKNLQMPPPGNIDGHCWYCFDEWGAGSGEVEWLPTPPQ